MVLNCLPPNEKETEEQYDREERKGERDPFAQRKPPQFVIQPMIASIRFPAHSMYFVTRPLFDRTHVRNPIRRAASVAGIQFDLFALSLRKYVATCVATHRFISGP